MGTFKEICRETPTSVNNRTEISWILS